LTFLALDFFQLEGVLTSMRKLFLIVVLLVLGANSPSYGQGGVGELTGLVYDQSGAVVAGAKVTLTNSTTGFERVMESTGGGVFRFPALPVVGGYSLSVEQSGFRTEKISGISISVGTTTTIDVHLAIGVQSESVTVEAGAELVNPSES
jgi:carboxypeptidase family protein